MLLGEVQGRLLVGARAIVWGLVTDPHADERNVEQLSIAVQLIDEVLGEIPFTHMDGAPGHMSEVV